MPKCSCHGKGLELLLDTTVSYRLQWQAKFQRHILFGIKSEESESWSLYRTKSLNFGTAVLFADFLRLWRKIPRKNLGETHLKMPSLRLTSTYDGQLACKEMCLFWKHCKHWKNLHLLEGRSFLRSGAAEHNSETHRGKRQTSEDDEGEVWGLATVSP